MSSSLKHDDFLKRVCSLDSVKKCCRDRDCGILFFDVQLSKLEIVSMKPTSASSNKWGNIWTAEAPFPIIPIFFPFKLILLLFGHSAVCQDSPFRILWSYECVNGHGLTRPDSPDANKPRESLSFEGCPTFELWNHWFMKSTNTTNEPIALHSRFLSIFFCSQFPFRSFFIPESFCYLSIESCIIRQSGFWFLKYLYLPPGGLPGHKPAQSIK